MVFLVMDVETLSLEQCESILDQWRAQTQQHQEWLEWMDENALCVCVEGAALRCKRPWFWFYVFSDDRRYSKTGGHVVEARGHRLASVRDRRIADSVVRAILEDGADVTIDARGRAADLLAKHRARDIKGCKTVERATYYGHNGDVIPVQPKPALPKGVYARYSALLTKSPR